MWGRRARAEAPARPWPDRTEHVRVLIEDADTASQWATRQVLEREGYDVATCVGPERLPQQRCPLVSDGRCELLEGADVVLHNLRRRDPANQAVLRCVRSAAPDTPVVVTATPHESRNGVLPAGCRVLLEPANGADVLRAVEAAAQQVG